MTIAKNVLLVTTVTPRWVHLTHVKHAHAMVVITRVTSQLVVPLSVTAVMVMKVTGARAVRVVITEYQLRYPF